MRFARGDMRDHIVSHKNDHGASYRRYGVLPWRSRLKINFCEIFDVVRFSTFATLSANNGSQMPARRNVKRSEFQCEEAGVPRSSSLQQNASQPLRLRNHNKVDRRGIF